jgi:hypothetical protein
MIACTYIVHAVVSTALSLQLFKNSKGHSREAQIEPPLIECE